MQCLRKTGRMSCQDVGSAAEIGHIRPMGLAKDFRFDRRFITAYLIRPIRPPVLSPTQYYSASCNDRRRQWGLGCKASSVKGRISDDSNDRVARGVKFSPQNAYFYYVPAAGCRSH